MRAVVMTLKMDENGGGLTVLADDWAAVSEMLMNLT